MRVRTDDIERFGGLPALQARVSAFQNALEAHKLTTGQPAPVEASLVELLARTKQKIEAWEPPPGRGSPADTVAVTNQMNEILLGLVQRIQQVELTLDTMRRPPVPGHAAPGQAVATPPVTETPKPQ